MANTQAMCTSFKVDVLNGLHAFGASVIRGATTKDTFNAALFKATGTLSASTASYTSVTADELAASGNYSTGGIAVTNASAPTSTTTTAWWNPSGNLVWAALTSSAAFDAVLIYNNTAAGKNAVSVHTFGSQSVTAGTFTLTMPTSDSTNALIRFA